MEMTPSEKISAAADVLVAENLNGWQTAATVLAERFEWTGAAIRIAAVQTAQLADARR